MKRLLKNKGTGCLFSFHDRLGLGAVTTPPFYKLLTQRPLGSPSFV